MAYHQQRLASYVQDGWDETLQHSSPQGSGRVQINNSSAISTCALDSCCQKKREARRVTGDGFIGQSWECLIHSVGQNPVTWSNLTERERGNVIFLVPKEKKMKWGLANTCYPCLGKPVWKHPEENGGVDTKIRGKAERAGPRDLIFSPSMQTLRTCPAQPASHSHGGLRPDTVQHGDPAGRPLHGLPTSSTSLRDPFLQ